MIVKTVGRGQDNNIVVNDTKVSRVHVQMVQDDNGNISVVDLGSANGTFVNDVRIAGETHLKSGDEVRIGDTRLPWQSYFSPVEKGHYSEVSRQTTSKGEKTDDSHPKRNMMWLYIAAGALLLIIIGGGFLIMHNKQKTEKVRTELEQTEEERHMLEMENKLKDAEKEAADLDAEYNLALEKAKTARTKHERDSLNGIVVAKEKLANEARNNVKKLTEDKKNLENKLADTKNKLSQTEEKLKAANAEKDKAEKDKENALKQASSEKSKADAAARQAELTGEFYKVLNEVKDKGRLKEACKALQISPEGNKNKQYDSIVNCFNNSKNDNAACEKIVNSLKDVLNNTTQNQKPRY